jgi:ElaB/YqjD/DUF883 family membrane-anchored ribosome-binding protein
MEHNTQSAESEESTYGQLGHTIQTEVESVRTQAKNIEEQLEAFVRERPVAAVFGALGFGFIVARIFSRR